MFANRLWDSKIFASAHFAVLVFRQRWREMAQFRLLKPRDLGDCAQSFPGGMPGSGVSAAALQFICRSNRPVV